VFFHKQQSCSTQCAQAIASEQLQYGLYIRIQRERFWVLVSFLSLDEFLLAHAPVKESPDDCFLNGGIEQHYLQHFLYYGIVMIGEHIYCQKYTNCSPMNCADILGNFHDANSQRMQNIWIQSPYLSPNFLRTMAPKHGLY